MNNDSAIQFSVVIPAYNAAETIIASVSSVLEQTLPPFEIIIVNDGSTDATEQLISGHFGNKIIYIALPQNAGPAHARNIAIARARGTHIAFQDADDFWHRDKLKIVADILNKQPGVQFLYHPYTLADIDSKIAEQDISIAPYPFTRLLFSNPIGTPCVVMKRHDHIRFNESMHYMEDYDLFLREGYRHGIFFLDLPLTRLSRPILSAGGQSSKRWEMRKGEFRAYFNLIKLNPLFILVSPFLMLFGLIKHAVKSFRPPRSNY